MAAPSKIDFPGAEEIPQEIDGDDKGEDKDAGDNDRQSSENRKRSGRIGLNRSDDTILRFLKDEEFGNLYPDNTPLKSEFFFLDPDDEMYGIVSIITFNNLMILFYLSHSLLYGADSSNKILGAYFYDDFRKAKMEIDRRRTRDNSILGKTPYVLTFYKVFLYHIMPPIVRKISEENISRYYDFNDKLITTIRSLRDEVGRKNIKLSKFVPEQLSTMIKPAR